MTELLFDGVEFKVEVSFSTSTGGANTVPIGGLSSDIVWTDVSEYVRDVTIKRGRSNELDSFTAGSAQVSFSNADRRFDPDYDAGPYFGALTPMRPIRISATPPGGSIQSMFVGFVDGWPQTYSPPNDSVVVVSCSDAFKVLTLTPLRSKWVDTVVADTPRSWLRMNEASGSSVISDSVDDYVGDSMSGVAGGPFDRNDGFYYSDGLYTAATGSQSESLVLSDTTDFSQEFNGIRWAQCENPRIFGSPVNYRGQYFGWPPLGVEMVFEIDADISTGSTYGLCAFGITGFPTCAAYVSISGGATPGFINLVCLILNTTGTIAVHSAQIGHIKNPASRGPRLLNFGRTTGGSTVANLDGSSVPYSTFFTKDPSINWYGWTVGHCYSTGSATYTAANPFKGKIDEVVLYDNVLSSARITEHNAVFDTLAGATSDVQIEQILDDIGAPTDARVIDAGLSTLQRYVPTGDALSYIQKIAEAEQGRFYVRADGALTFRTRNSINTQSAYNTTQLSLTDSEYVEFSPNFTDQLIKNEVSITRAGGVPITRSSPLSQGQYWLRPESLSGLLNNESTTISYMAEARLQAYRFPRPRVDAVSIMPRGCGLWDEAIGFDIGTRIETTRLPQGVGDPIVQTAIIEGIEHSITPSNWVTTWLLSPSVVTDFLVIGNPELDKVENASARLGF
jgi:hypothetical protein